MQFALSYVKEGHKMLIFISGVHGSGKSYFCKKVKAELGIEVFSASLLIAESKQAGFSKDKLIPDIDENQKYLLLAIQKLNTAKSPYLLDGHFCLLDGQGSVTRIPKETFSALKPIAIVLLTEKSNVIAERRKQRDNIDHDVCKIEAFQSEETGYAIEIAEELGIPIKISIGESDLDDTLDFIRATMRRMQNGR